MTVIVPLPAERLRSQTTSLGLVDLVRGSTSSLTRTNDTHPVWSPDSRRVAYTSDRLGSFDLYLRALDAADDKLLLQSPLWKYPDDWSPDGKWLLYEEIDPTTRRNLYALPVDGSAAPTPVPIARSGANEWFARFSPDGRWIAYASDEGGRDDIYVQAYPSGTNKMLISTNGGNQPTWRGDGRALYYVSMENHVMRVDLAATATTVTAAKPVDLFAAPLYYRSNSQISDWVFDAARDGKRFLLGLPATDSRASAIELLIGYR